jgi:hypothetical protein
MLLKPELFSDRREAMTRFWALVTQAARTQGLDIMPNASFPGSGRNRFVSFIDTPDFGLYKKGYILRRRQYTTLDPAMKLRGRGEKHDLTLKFRNSELMLEVLENLQVGMGNTGETKIEEDVVLGPDEMRKVYSLSTKVKRRDETGTTLKEYARVFPGLKNLGFSEDEALQTVNGVVINEFSTTPGGIELERGVVAASTFSFWYKKGETQPLVVEFSFTYPVKADSRTNSRMYRSNLAADTLLKSIQKSAQSWLSSAQTKTGLIYKMTVPDQD